jgi:hypothetical protein
VNGSSQAIPDRRERRVAPATQDQNEVIANIVPQFRNIAKCHSAADTLHHSHASANLQIRIFEPWDIPMDIVILSNCIVRRRWGRKIFTTYLKEKPAYPPKKATKSRPA